MKNKTLILAKLVSQVTGEERLRSFHATLLGDLDGFLSKASTSPHQKYAAFRLYDRAKKKFNVKSNEKMLRQQAELDFLSVNSKVGVVSPNLQNDVASNARHFIRTALERATRDYSSVPQDCLSLGLLLQLWKHGPGASQGIVGTHFVSKITSKTQTVTAGALPYANLLRKCNSRIQKIIDSTGHGFTLVAGSRLEAVPKNEDTQRTIAIEPLWNMALQLAAGCYIELALRRVGLDISTQQDKNKLLAGVASIDRSLATIDLKSASDMISPSLIEALWPEEWFQLLMALRSPTMETMSGERVTLNMMSTMGNGFTFPMMTLTLLALVYGVQSCQGPRKRSMQWDPNTVGVFGDDIICPVEDYEAVCATLFDAGLVVNSDKSFASGHFRESCGGDYWMGYNVTPIYVRSLRSDPEIYVALNQLIEWGSLHNIYLNRSITLLASFLTTESPFFVPVWEAPYSGVRTSLVGRRYKAWELIPFRRRKDLSASDPMVALLAILGGYVMSTTDDSCLYMPRCKNQRYKLTLARRPRGFLDGSSTPYGGGVEIDDYVLQLFYEVLPVIREEAGLS